MSPNNEIDQRTRENEAALLRELAHVGQSCAAEGMGVSASTITRMKEPKASDEASEIQKIARFLAVLNMRPVGADTLCIGRDQMIFYQKTTAQALLANASMLERGYQDGVNAGLMQAGKVGRHE